MSRPEFVSPPEIYYDDSEALRYTKSTRIAKIQALLSQRAIQLLELPKSPQLVLDLGCGSGLSGEIIENNGHTWVGMDISPAMLNVAKERDVEGDLLLKDLGQGLPFRPGSFDAAISVSAIQWLCNADKKSNNPMKRLKTFFASLFSTLKRGAKAVLQFYPSNDDQIFMITNTALKAGFTGGLVIDDQESNKLRKYFLYLCCGYAAEKIPPSINSENIDTSTEGVEYFNKKISKRKTKFKGIKKDRDFVSRKKEIARSKGKKVPLDSKYSGRQRKPKF